MAKLVKQLIKKKLESEPEFMFPVSTRPQVRHLVLRNATGGDLAVKLRSSNEELLHPRSSNMIVRANQWLAIPVTLYVVGLVEKVELQFQSLRIFCRRFNRRHPHPDNGPCWFEDDSNNARYLVRSLKVTRTKQFAALETVVDLPGSSALIETPPFATVGLVDDSDCRTAHHVDSDTSTACVIEPEHWGAIAADSCISTAHRIDEGMPTARDMNDQNAACWIGDALKSLYPAGGKKKTGDQASGYGSVFPCGGSD